MAFSKTEVNDSEPEFDPYVLVNPWERRAKNRGRNTLIMLVLVVLALGIVGATGSFLVYDSLRTADISAYDQMGISISGLTDEDFIVTPAELSEYGTVSLTATGSGMGAEGQSKAGAVQAYGPDLEAFLSGYGYTRDDFRSIVFLCKDGYSTALRPSRMSGEQVVMSIASGKEALAPYQQPLRLVIPDMSTGNWCFGILRIEFNAEDSELSDRDILGDELVDTQQEQQQREGDQ